MSYEVINEELKIAKCSITDLTIGQVHNFLESWGDDSKIGTLTMFYDREKELLVLNEDNDMYETCLMTATAYLSGDYERRKELLKNAPEGIVESVKLLEKVFKYRLFDKRTFQALRIELNKELEVLENSIDEMIELLNDGGRLCIITFHSLEDRIVKSVFKKNENPCTCPPDFPVCVCGKVSKGCVVTRKPILPSEEELEYNSRSKSAKLRIFERR